VYFEVLTSGEHFSAAGEGTREWFLAGVHADVVDEFVLGLEGSSVARAAVPEAGVRGALGAADVFHRDVRNDFVHGAEHFGAHFARRQRLRLHPHAAQLLLQRRRLPHVAEEGAVVVRRRRRLRRRLLVHRRRRRRVVHELVRVGVARVLVVLGAAAVLVLVLRRELRGGRRHRGAEHLVVVVRLRVVHRVHVATQQKVARRVVVVVVVRRMVTNRGGHRHRRRRRGAVLLLHLVLVGAAALAAAGAQLQPQPRRVHERVEHILCSRYNGCIPCRAPHATDLIATSAAIASDAPPSRLRVPPLATALARTAAPIAQRAVPERQWHAGGGRNTRNTRSENKNMPRFFTFFSSATCKLRFLHLNSLKPCLLF